MRYFPAVDDFISYNQSQIKKITLSICYRYGIPCVDDVLQDVYETIISKDTVGTYNPNHPSATKISTYLYNRIRFVARSYRKSNETFIECHQSKPNPRYSTYSEEEHLDTDYENILYTNQISDAIDGLNLDLNLFEEYLEKRDKFYKLNKRKHMEIATKGLSLLSIFRLLRQGYLNKDIALKYGVTPMFITSLKTDLKKQLLKFGIYWKETKQKRPKKQFMTDAEIDEYADEFKK